jgi:hypothetical protein
MADDVVSALDDPVALVGALARVVGRGPGLTPAGDDVLVGILAVLTLSPSSLSCARAARSMGRMLGPLLPTTTEISGHLLRQACDGCFGRAVHELVFALIEGGTRERLDACVLRVVAMGATSGADTCAGVVAAAQRFLVPRFESAAA